MMHVINAPGRTIGTMPAWVVNIASVSNFRHRCNSAVTTPILVEELEGIAGEAVDERQDKKFLSVPGDR